MVRWFERLRYPATVFAVAIVAFGTLLAVHAYTGGVFTDLKAFYCAGSAFAGGHDPYRLAFVRPCEARLGAGVFAGAAFDQPTVPVPWAPYAMPLLAALAALPFAAAVVVWTLMNFAALALAADLLRRMLPERSPVAIATLVIFAGVPTEAALGQPVGFGLLAIVAAGAFVRRGQSAGIACALFVAAIQPYVALPLAIALLATNRAARIGVASCVAAIALGSLVFERGLTQEYLTAVAPAHAAGNLLEVTQLSLTSLLAALGTPSVIARDAGLAVYAVAIVAGVWAGRRMARSSQRPERIAWIATMLATLAAPYLHFQQLASALPGALAILVVAPAAIVAEFAVVGLFVPWIGLLLQTTYSYTIAPFAAVSAWGTARRRVTRIAVLAFALIVIDLAISGYARAHVINPHAFHPPHASDDSLIDDAWTPFVAVIWASLGVASLPARFVTALCAVLLAAATVVAAARVEVRRNA
jgi:hypothetical protein